MRMIRCKFIETSAGSLRQPMGWGNGSKGKSCEVDVTKVTKLSRNGKKTAMSRAAVGNTPHSSKSKTGGPKRNAPLRG